MASSRASSAASRPSSAKVPAPKLKEFVFTDKLGSGTYATVYKAYRKSGAREVVAVKCVLKTTLNKASTENLLTEIQLLKHLKHDHIVELRDFQWDENYIYLIMEYCSGGDLSRLIHQRRALPEQIVKRFLQQLALAMKFLSENNVAHMDLKPQNILVASPMDPILKIGDFGFAKLMNDGDELSVMRGSPLYMAPEIVCKASYDARVDIWSLGVIFYECLFGKAPFASKSYKELGAKIWDSKPIEPPAGVEVSDTCRDLLVSMLKRDPDERILFDAFFSHPFLDLEHAPTAACLPRATELVSEAVAKDQASDHKAAIRLYCEALAYFVPAIHYERDQKKKEVLRQKVKEYMERAEVLKKLVRPHGSEKGLRRSCSEAEAASVFEELTKLSEDHAELNAALKLIGAAEREAEKEAFAQASTHYQLALGALLKIMRDEPKGRRKELIMSQMDRWMTKAEEVKSYLEMEKLSTRDTSKQEEESARHYLNAASGLEPLPDVESGYTEDGGLLDYCCIQ